MYLHKKHYKDITLKKEYADIISVSNMDIISFGVLARSFESLYKHMYPINGSICHVEDQTLSS